MKDNAITLLENTDIMKRYAILAEAYRGKTKQLKNCELALEEMIKKVKASHNDGFVAADKILRSNYDINSSKENDILQSELCDMFKLHNVTIYWPIGTTNAFTLMPFPYGSYDASHKVFDNDTGTSCLNVYIVVYEDLITQCDLSAKELLAVILHEMGHNFYLCPVVTTISLFSWIFCLPVHVLNRVGVVVGKEVDTLLRKYLSPIYNIAKNFNKFFNDIQTSTPMKLLNGLAFLVASFVGSISQGGPASYFINLFNYGNEKGADSFATMYGYGPDLITGLKKMERPVNSIYNKTVSKVDAYKAVDQTVFDITSLLFDFGCLLSGDPHPSNYQRCLSLIDKLRDDLNSGDYPPQYKKEVQSQIKQLEKTLKTVNVHYDDENYPTIRQGVYNCINKLFDGKADIREFVDFLYKQNRF